MLVKGAPGGRGNVVANLHMTYLKHVWWKLLHFDYNVNAFFFSGANDDTSALLHVMACGRIGEKSLPEPMISQLWRHVVSVGLTAIISNMHVDDQ